MGNSFSQDGKKKMVKYTIKAINDLLAILNSPIVYPTDEDGNVMEHRLLAVVKSREQVYVSTMNMMRLIEVNNDKFIHEIIKGLKNTWIELTNITTRDIGSTVSESLRKDLKTNDSRHEIQDNYLSHVAQAKELSAKVAFNILERIDMLEMSDEDKESKVINKHIINTAERYAT